MQNCRTGVKITKKKIEGDKFEHIASQFGSTQIIDDTTYILDSSSSYIDLIFTSQPDLVIESVVRPSLHQNCHHQIIYAKLNLQIFFLHHTVHKFGTSKILLMI